MITNTPMGNIAKGIMESGARLGVSSRGMGSLKLNKEGVNEVQDDFRLATAADIVADPSAPNAWVNGIMENCDWVYDDYLGWKAVQIIEDTKKNIEAAVASKSLTENTKLKMFESFLNKISKI
jgi:hypothetical protein